MEGLLCRLAHRGATWRQIEAHLLEGPEFVVGVGEAVAVGRQLRSRVRADHGQRRVVLVATDVHQQLQRDRSYHHNTHPNTGRVCCVHYKQMLSTSNACVV